MDGLALERHCMGAADKPPPVYGMLLLFSSEKTITM